MARKRTNCLLITILICTAVFICGAASSFAASSPEGTGKVSAKGGAVLRYSSSTSSKKVATLPKNTPVTIKKIIFKSKTSTSSKNKWYYVAANGKTGYLRSDLVGSRSYPGYTATVTKKCNYRAGAGTKMKSKGTLKKGKVVTVCLAAKPTSSTKGSSSTWYMVKVGSKKYYAASTYFAVNEPAPVVPQGEVAAGAANKYSSMTEAEFTQYLVGQGFPQDYINKLVPLHAQHPNWIFKSCITGLNWSDVIKKETASKVSLTNVSSYKKNTTVVEGGGWCEAKQAAVEYFVDPRNFLNEDRICMFENLAYDPDTDSTKVVNKILSPTKLPGYGFTGDIFVSAGKANNISPAFLASRARQETGGGSDCINGTGVVNGKVCYNPFNIGAGTNLNPVQHALQKAYDSGWFTQATAINAGAAYLAKNYINAGQNTIYFQKYNVANGLSKVATHQYMTNIKAANDEAYSVMQSYRSIGTDTEDISFIIPVFNGMPAATYLP